jgi:DNA-binding transcriptional MerR regulator
VLPVVADIRPSGATLLDAYRQHAIKRSAGEYNIYKVAEMLQSEHIRTLPRQAKRAAILLALQAAGVKLQDVIDDAVQQNEALDNAARARETALGEFEARKEQVNRKLQVMIESLVAEYDARIQRNNEEVSAERDKFAEWKLAKIQEEQKIADAVSYLLDENAASA